MVKTYRERRIDEEAFISAIGNITIKFAGLEELITGCINILIGGEVASVVTVGLPFSRSLTILGALYRQKHNIGQDEDIPNHLTELLKQAEKAGEERNKIIHSIWYSGDTQETLTRIKRNVSRNKGLKIDTEQVTIQDLNNVSNIIENAVYTAQEFTWELLMNYITYQILPLEGAVVDVKPELSWRRVEGAIGYELTIAKESNFIENSVSKMGEDCIRSTEYKCEIPLEHSTTYYWRVRPIIATEKGYWSEVRSFTVI